MIPTSDRVRRLRTAALIWLGLLWLFTGVFAASVVQSAPRSQARTVVPTETSTPSVTTTTATATLTSTIESTLTSTVPVITVSEILSESIELKASANTPLNLRTGPSVSNAVIHALRVGTLLTVIGRNQDCTWLHVQPEDGTEGWVSRYYVSVFQIITMENGTKSKQPVEDICETLIFSSFVLNWTPTPEATATSTPAATEIPQPTPEDTPAALPMPVVTPTVDPPAGIDWQRVMVPTFGLFVLLLVGLLLWRGAHAGWLPLPAGKTVSLNFPVTIPAFWSRQNKRGWLTQPPQKGIPFLEGKLASGEVIFAALAQKEISIGRDADNLLVVDDRFADADSISRHHARIEQDGARFVVVDLKSQNGVYVSGRRTRENLLFDGARFALGKVEFVFHENSKK